MPDGNLGSGNTDLAVKESKATSELGNIELMQVRKKV